MHCVLCTIDWQHQVCSWTQNYYNFISNKKCSICNTNFEQKRDLNKHVATAHVGKKPFICEMCNANFEQKVNLNKHVATVHEGKKPFKCDNCDANFSEKSKLKNNVTSVHEGNKPF